MTEKMLSEFSFRTRKAALDRFERETFDLLVIGGGITGAAAARDAALRGLKVALVERTDFAEGTSSRSSKLIHGGLRYLENLEFGLVFEALAERAHLLKTAPHMVRPLPFYFPVYQGDRTPKFILRLGMWLYDVLALFRAPGFHRGLSKRKMLSEIPFLNEQGLKGGFQYYDASMWDDVLVIENLRSAVTAGAAVANYVEAVSPLWNGDLISGFKVKDLEASGADREIQLRAKRVVVCAGPWTDEIGSRISENWRPWLNPSKGVHLVFDLKRIPIAGAMVMSHPEDGRISFVIPRPDLGGGVVIVGTTDSPSPKDPAKSTIDPQDVQYLMTMLQKYFPKLELKTSDILSAYVGVRPLMGQVEAEGGAGAAAASLQKVSREHYIGPGPGGTVVVAGGKYTTHRKMAEEIIDFTLDHWKMDSEKGRGPEFVQPGPKSGELPVNPQTVADVTAKTRREAQAQGLNVPEQLWDRYGAEALKIFEMSKSPSEYPDGFPALDAQLRHAIRNEMVLHLDDFYLRRAPLYLARADHGRPWAAALAKVWAEERGGSEGEVAAELARLEREVAKYSDWMKSVT